MNARMVMSTPALSAPRAAPRPQRPRSSPVPSAVACARAKLESWAKRGYHEAAIYQLPNTDLMVVPCDSLHERALRETDARFVRMVSQARDGFAMVLASELQVGDRLPDDRHVVAIAHEQGALHVTVCDARNAPSLMRVGEEAVIERALPDELQPGAYVLGSDLAHVGQRSLGDLAAGLWFQRGHQRRLLGSLRAPGCDDLLDLTVGAGRANAQLILNLPALVAAATDYDVEAMRAVIAAIETPVPIDAHHQCPARLVRTPGPWSMLSNGIIGPTWTRIAPEDEGDFPGTRLLAYFGNDGDLPADWRFSCVSVRRSSFHAVAAIGTGGLAPTGMNARHALAIAGAPLLLHEAKRFVHHVDVAGWSQRDELATALRGALHSGTALADVYQRAVL